MGLIFQAAALPLQVAVGSEVYDLYTSANPLPSNTGTLMNVAVFTASGSLKLNARTTQIEALITAGGGGGAGVAATSREGQVWIGGGGGASSTLLIRTAATGGGTLTITVGAGGTPGNGTANGGTGGYTFVSGTPPISCPGVPGGSGGRGGVGGSAGTGSTGGLFYLNFGGSDGEAGTVIGGNSPLWMGGRGGGSFWGDSQPFSPYEEWDATRSAPGAGGSGGVAIDLDGAVCPGAPGASGVVIVREYCI